MFISRVFHPAAPGEPEAYIVSTSTASTLNTGTHTDVTSEANAMADAPPSALASGTPRITWFDRNVACAMTALCARLFAVRCATRMPSAMEKRIPPMI